VTGAAERGAARSLALSGSLDRRIAQLERLAAAPCWVCTPRGSALDVARQILALAEIARRHIAAARYAAAVDACAAGDRLASTTSVTIAAARVRALTTADAAKMSSLAKRSAAKRRQAAADRIVDYLAEARRLRDGRDGDGWTLSAIIQHLRRNDRDCPYGPRQRQLRRHLQEHGLK
jgi:hypothetical protein